MGVTHQLLLDIERSPFLAEQGAVGMPEGVPTNAAEPFLGSQTATDLLQLRR
jgi:hypothetical protein